MNKPTANPPITPTTGAELRTLWRQAREAYAEHPTPERRQAVTAAMDAYAAWLLPQLRPKGSPHA